MNIKQQINYIKHNYQISLLGDNYDLSNFNNAKQESLITYLKESALIEQQKNLTRVFLVEEKNTGKICFYFSLRCGLLYSRTPNNDSPASKKENEVRQILVEAYENGNYEEIIEGLRTDEDFSKCLEAAKYSFEKSCQNLNCNDRSEPVEHTFPAIELKEFVRNESYKIPTDLTFAFGALVFWGLIVPRIQSISHLVGVQYLYLFSVDGIGGKLYKYYKDVLSFSNNNYCVLKPVYDQNCHALVQEVTDLQNNYEMFCAQNSLEIKDDD